MARVDHKRRLMGEINVVPYIDVMLVLLIIFMVTAPLLTQGIEVELPKAGAEPLEPTESEPLVLSIDREGLLYLNIGEDTESALDQRTVVKRTAAVLRRAPETPVLVKADTLVPYGEVVTAMVLLQQAGAAQVGFLTDPLDVGPLDLGEPESE
ncbi:MAG: protein TolR [Gammaproteobacteria bacterium]|jgi:biopolymer transport protein TolR